MPPQNPTANAKASQDLIPIEEVRNGVVILKNGSLRMVVMASSVNFALKSGDEQDAIILQYQSFLNSLDFPIQIFVQSCHLNINPYLETLRSQLKTETNELLKIQISEYIVFIKAFVESSSIVTKTFYIVIAFTPSGMPNMNSKRGGGLAGLFGGAKKEPGAPTFDPAQFEEYRIQLLQRVNVVIDGLARTGVRTVPLNTEELIELYYGLYNPEASGKGKAPQLLGKEIRT